MDHNGPITHGELAELAVNAADGAYVPYSGFHVGAALIDTDGNVTIGANVESASYGLTCCAERTAIFAHLVRHPGARIRRIAVACPDGNPAGDPNSVMPCGACRQIISEHLDPRGVIDVVGVGMFEIDELLPSAFTLASS